MNTPILRCLRCVLTMVILPLITSSAASANAPSASGWISLFNGKNLDGWTPKISGHPVGENFGNTFRVENGVLKAEYDRYGGKFALQFGHLFTDIPYANYIVRLEYLITGDVLPDAPSWAGYNSGVMIHAQSPQSMGLDQSWPVSVEGQILAEGTSAGRQTANAVTIGTRILIDGQPSTRHVMDSTSRLYPLDHWVTFEIEVHGNELVIHRINGEEVMRYTHPVLVDTDVDAKRLLDAGASRELSYGFIALQAEGHPVWFRNIKIRPLDTR